MSLPCPYFAKQGHCNVTIPFPNELAKLTIIFLTFNTYFLNSSPKDKIFRLYNCVALLKILLY